jgi:guanine deaminase
MSAPAGGKSLFLGSFIHSKGLDELEFLHETAICVDDRGVIVAIQKARDQKAAEETLFPQLGWTVGKVSVRIAKPGQFFFPGFIGLCTSPIIELLLILSRYSYPCLSVSQCRNLW